MMCQRIGRPPISTIGFGRTVLSSEIRVPKPPARMTAFMPAFHQSPLLLLPVPVDRACESFVQSRRGTPAEEVEGAAYLRDPLVLQRPVRQTPVLRLRSPRDQGSDPLDEFSDRDRTARAHVHLRAGRHRRGSSRKERLNDIGYEDEIDS